MRPYPKARLHWYWRDDVRRLWRWITRRVWPWSVLHGAYVLDVGRRRELASMEHVVKTANKTIEEFQHRLYVLGDKSALDQRDPRLWNPEWFATLAASIESWTYEADCLEEVDPRTWSDRLGYLKSTLDSYVRPRQ